MQTHKTILATSIVACGLLAFPVLSQGYDGGHSQRSSHHCHQAADAGAMAGWGRLANRLNLTPEQRQSFYAINDKYRPALRDLRQQLSDQRRSLAKMDATDAKLQEMAEAQGKTVANMIVMRKMMRAEMDKLLTDEQREKLGNLLKQSWHRRHHPEDMSPG